MGTDINAVFGHREPFPPTDPLMEAMRKGLGGEWDVLRDHDPGCGRVYVRGKVCMSFGPHAASASTGYGWLDDRDDLRAELDTIRAVARFFHSPGVIFLPDDIEPYFFVSEWIGEGLTFDDLQKKLAAIREPSPDFRAAMRQMPEYCEVDGYVIEKLDYDDAT